MSSVYRSREHPYWYREETRDPKRKKTLRGNPRGRPQPKMTPASSGDFSCMLPNISKEDPIEEDPIPFRRPHLRRPIDPHSLQKTPSEKTQRPLQKTPITFRRPHRRRARLPTYRDPSWRTRAARRACCGRRSRARGPPSRPAATPVRGGAAPPCCWTSRPAREERVRVTCGNILEEVV